MHTRKLLTLSLILTLLLCVVLLHAGTIKKIYCANNNIKLQEEAREILATADFKANRFLPSLLIF